MPPAMQRRCLLRDHGRDRAGGGQGHPEDFVVVAWQPRADSVTQPPGAEHGHASNMVQRWVRTFLIVRAWPLPFPLPLRAAGFVIENPRTAGPLLAEDSPATAVVRAKAP